MISIAGWEIRRTLKRTPTRSGSKGKTGAPTSGRAKSAGAKSAAAKKPGTAQKAAKAVAAKTADPASPPLQRDSLGSRAGRVLVMLLAFACMVGFAAALAKATLVPQPGSSDLVHTNLRPGDSLRAYVDQPAIRDTVKQIGGNVLLGAPFGVLLPMLVPKARGAVRVVLVTSLVMVLVEIAQGAIVEGRAFDIDDVILNTSGALLGYVLIGRRLGHALHPRRHHWWQRRRTSA
ncbi:VanZ family protein [Streptomyces botrytidirepellens]